MAGKLLVRGRLNTARAPARTVHEQRPLSESATRRRVRTRQGVVWGIAAAATVGLVAASTVIPRAGSLLPVAVVVVGAGWAAIGLVHGVVVLAARIGRRRPPRIAAVEEGVGHLSIVTRHARTILAAIADHHSVPDHATGGTR